MFGIQVCTVSSPTATGKKGDNLIFFYFCRTHRHADDHGHALEQKFDNLASTLARRYRKVKTPVFPYAKCIAILSNKILNVHTIYIDSPRIYEYTVYLISVVCGFLIVKVLHNPYQQLSKL